MEDTQSRALAFEEMVAAIFTAHGFKVSESTGGSRGYDRLATLDGIEFAIEARHFKQATPDFSLLEMAASRLEMAMKVERIRYGFLVVSCLMLPSIEMDLHERHGIVIVGRDLLFAWATRDGGGALTKRAMALLNLEFNDRLIETVNALPRTPLDMFDDPLEP